MELGQRFSTNRQVNCAMGDGLLEIVLELKDCSKNVLIKLILELGQARIYFKQYNSFFFFSNLFSTKTCKCIFSHKCQVRVTLKFQGDKIMDILGVHEHENNLLGSLLNLVWALLWLAHDIID